MSTFKIFLPFFSLCLIAGLASYKYIALPEMKASESSEFIKDINNLKVQKKLLASPTAQTSAILFHREQEEKQKVVESIFALQKPQLTQEEKKEQEKLQLAFQKKDTYELLVASLPSRKEARDFISQHGLESFKPRISPSLKDGKRMFGVHIGGFKTKESAEILKRKMEQEKYMKVSILGF